MNGPTLAPQWFYGYNEDCFDPIRFLVRADSWEDAYETLICHPRMVAAIEITPELAADYGMGPDGEDAPNYNEDGIPVDTEGLHMFGPVSVRLIRGAEVPAGW